jgi:ATP-dependent Clp protease protease subunit
MMGLPSELNNRSIVLSTMIDDEVAGQIVAHIMNINQIDAELSSSLANYTPEPIEMFINSNGGSATAGNAIIGAMEMSETPIITYGLGSVASMALAIFASGDVRIAHRFTRFMYHSVAYGADGFIKDHEDAQIESDILQRMYNSIFLDRTKLSAERMADIRDRKSNFFFSGKEAVKLGFADEVFLKPQKKFDVMTQEEFDDIEQELIKLKL